jgi:hypothetical protein
VKVVGKRDNAQVFRITGARQGLAEDVRGRQRRYAISMSVRTVSFLLAVLLWNVERHIAAVALVLGLVLPYVAVVIANAGRENAPSPPPAVVPPTGRLALRTGSRDSTADASSGSAPGAPAPSMPLEQGERPREHG